MAAAPSDATRKRAAWLDRLESQSRKKSRSDDAEEEESKRGHDEVETIKTESEVQSTNSDAADLESAASSSSTAAATLSPSSASSSSIAAITASSSSSSAAAVALPAFSSSKLPAAPIVKTEPDAPWSSPSTLPSRAAAPAAAAASFSSPASSAFTPWSAASSSSSSSSSTAGAPAHSASSSSSSLSSIASLSAMGFEERIVVEALKRSGGNVEGALEMMLAGVIDAKPASKSSSSSSVSPSLGSMLRSPDRPSAAAAAASASPNAPTRATPTTLGTVRFDGGGWITWRPFGGGSSSCTCRKSKPSGGSNIVTLSSLSAAASSSLSCASCRLASLEPLPSTLAGVRFSPDAAYRGKFDSFVALYRPSQIRADQCAWIVVRMPSDEDADSRWAHTFGMDRLQDEWNKCGTKNAAAIKALAQRSGYVSGKWMIMPGAASVDTIWRNVTSAIVAGLIPGVNTAKVSPVNGPGGGPTHVICIYTDDWTDEADVMRIRELLRTHCNVHWRLNYKADIYTSLDIYYKNPLKIKPTVYSA